MLQEKESTRSVSDFIGCWHASKASTVQTSVLDALQSGVDGEHLGDLVDAFGSVRALALVDAIAVIWWLDAAELVAGQARTQPTSDGTRSGRHSPFYGMAPATVSGHRLGGRCYAKRLGAQNLPAGRPPTDVPITDHFGGFRSRSF